MPMVSDVRIGKRPRVPRSGDPHGESRVGRARARLVRFKLRAVPLCAGEYQCPASVTISIRHVRTRQVRRSRRHRRVVRGSEPGCRASTLVAPCRLFRLTNEIRKPNLACSRQRLLLS